jgi:hypothetical protein
MDERDNKVGKGPKKGTSANSRKRKTIDSDSDNDFEVYYNFCCSSLSHLKSISNITLNANVVHTEEVKI